METAKKIDIEDITVYKDELQEVVSTYCIQNDIDEANIYPTVWNDILTEIYEQIYLKDIELLHDIPNYSNQYNSNCFNHRKFSHFFYALLLLYTTASSI